jgi:predicted MPP superfamily phosphohydrolase
MFALFFIIALTILVLGFTYTGWRLIGPIRLPGRWRLAAWLALAVCFLLPLTALLSRFAGDRSLSVGILGWSGYLSLAFFNFIFFFVLGKDVARLLALVFRRTAALFGNPVKAGEKKREGAPDDTERRVFLARVLSGSGVALSALVVGYGVFQARRDPRVKLVHVALPNLPSSFEGFRILQISDLHAGSTVRRDFISRVAETVRARKADLIAVTGDLVDGTVEQLRSDLEPLCDLEAPCGVYFVTGNHEYYSGVESWLREVERMGMTPLLNRHRILERDGGCIVLAGVPDIRASRLEPSHIHDPAGALAGAPSDAVRILLAHQPLSIVAAEKAGYDLMICGHTHGGQYAPWMLVSGLVNRYVSGLHRHGKAQIYVSNGTGYWGPPVRVGAPSEIAEIVLHAEAKGS